MRVFWGLVAVVVLVALAIPALSGMSARAERAAAEHARATAEAAQQEIDRRATEEATMDDPSLKPGREKPDSVLDAGSAAAGRDTAALPTPADPSSPTSARKSDPVNPDSATPRTVSDPTTSTPAPVPDPAPVTPASHQTRNEPTVTPAATTPVTAPAAPKIVNRDDGSILVDDRFVMKGKGTAESPYEVTWELLLSANETYDPRLGRKKLPARVTMLDGKVVRLVGYVAYPMFVEQPRELLSMLNQWDGCCIGVPPTPYDAVEVHLKEVVTKEERLATYGTLEGKFAVKPFLSGDWLVGLYVMEEAKLTVKEYGGFGT